MAKPITSNVKKYKRLYKIWRGMKDRCNNPNSPIYRYYGGRGIKVCDRWNNSFVDFRDDVLNLYMENLSLDRIDTYKGYSKENCRWATDLEQANNTRANRFFEFNGLKKTLSQWSRCLGIKRSTLAQRFYVYKWDITKCLTKGGQIG